MKKNKKKWHCVCWIEIVSALPLPLPLLLLVNWYVCMYKQANGKNERSKKMKKKIHKRTTKAAEKNREKKMLYRVFHSLILVALWWRVSVYLSFSHSASWFVHHSVFFRLRYEFQLLLLLLLFLLLLLLQYSAHCHTVLFYSKFWWRVFAYVYYSMMVFSHLFYVWLISVFFFPSQFFVFTFLFKKTIMNRKKTMHRIIGTVRNDIAKLCSYA